MAYRNRALVRAPLFALLFCLFCASFAAAQEFRAAITGRVIDSSEAVVAGATVEARNIETNVVTTATTDGLGNYNLLFLRPGGYAVSVQAAGFKKFTRAGLLLNVGQTATVDVKLEVGAVSEQVTVTAETPLLETAKADRGNVIGEKLVAELPLNSRNPFMLAMFTAGVNFVGAYIYQRPFDNGAIAQWSINGSGMMESEYLLDGAPNNAQAGTNNIALVPPVDAVQEFKIQTNSYDAQYGKTGGGIVNVSLKSGTNTLHGTLYEFARRNSWDANMFQNNARGAPREGHLLDQYGGQVEGPVIVPKLWDGRNRTFFMISYERYREDTPNPFTLSVPEPEMRGGDFSRLVDGQGRPILTYDPSTGRSVGATWVRDPFPGNRIPAGRINPIARNMLDFMPLPNMSTPGVEYSSQNFYFGGDDPGSHAKDGFYNFVAKFDQNIGDKHRIFYRHANNDRFQDRSTNGLHRTPAEEGYSSHQRINDAHVLDWVGTLRPSFILNVRGSFNRFHVRNETAGNRGYDIAKLGFPASLASQLPYGPRFGRYTFAGYISLGNYPNGDITNNVALHPTATKVAGGHVIKTGVDLRWVQFAQQNTGNVFNLNAARDVTQRDYARADALSGNSIASWLLGTVSSGSVAYNAFPIFLYKYYAPYIQDDWKVSPRLTLNLGLRLDFNISPNERFNRMNRSFDPQVVNPIDKSIDRALFAGLPTLRGSLLFAGVNGLPRNATDLDRDNWQPRIGAAWRLTNRLVLRGGWGRYYLNPDNDYLQTNGFSQSTPYIASLDGGRTYLPNTLNNPFPDGVQVPSGSSQGALSFLGRGFNFVNTAFEVPYVNQFSFGLQYELPLRSRIEASYVGSRSRKQQGSKPFNAMDLNSRRSCNLMEGGNPLYCDERVANPFVGLEPFFGTTHYSSTTIARSQMMRPLPHFGALTEMTRNDGAMWYNSLQMVYEMRLPGVSLIANYTLSKHVERLGFNDEQQGAMRQGLFQYDMPHRMSLATVFDFPFGNGKRLFGGAGGFWGSVASGWQGTVLFQSQSGTPWALPSNVLYLKEARIKDIDWSQPRVQGVQPCVSRWNDNGTITMQPFSTRAGCTEANFLILPRYAPRFTPARDGRLRLHTVPQADVSISKMTQVTERTKIQFRAEAFNVTNTYMFHRMEFNNNPESANFGSLDPAAASYSQGNWPRQIQLAVKFIW